MTRSAAVVLAAVFGLTAGAGSSTKPAAQPSMTTSKSLADKLKHAGLCKSTAPASRAVERMGDRVLEGSWQCIGPSDPKAGAVYVWAAKSVDDARSVFAATQRALRTGCQALQGSPGTIAHFDVFPIAECETWLAAANPPFVQRVADTLGGQAVKYSC